MSSPDSQFDPQLEAFLDGALSDAERAAFVRRLHEDEALRGAVDLQERIDAALVRTFVGEAAAADQFAAGLRQDLLRQETTIATQPAVAERSAPRAALASRRTLLAGLLATAAALAAVFAGRDWLSGDRRPAFTPLPLAAIYRDAVKEGFEPYYECHDPQRFADTFARRQGTALKLLPMAAGSRMLGLSYLGGLSRDTTAMLCIVDEQPVLVFVDRQRDDRVQDESQLGGLHLFRKQDRGLVYYEVTPYAEERVLKSLVPRDAAG